MASLHLDGVEKSYGATRVLHRVDLEARDGEFIVMVGPSGCGKSTLLRSIAGLEDVTSGKIWIGEREVQDLPPKERDIAMVFQSYALYPHMTVQENMGFALTLQKHPERDARVAEAARMLKLEPLLARYPRELSGGQRQRVAMGRAIVRRPKVFLFDEPLSNLDAALRQELRVEIKRLHQQLQTTIVYVTHDQVEALTLADRILVLQGGVVQQLGTPDELYFDPANRFVAGFIGSPTMNFLSQVEPGVVLGVRPNDVHIERRATPPDNTVVVTGQVEVVERLGFESMVHVRVGGEPLVARVEGEIPSGELRLRLTRVYRFDPTSGARIRS